MPFKELVSTLDRGLGNLLKDLAARNLLRETLVVCATECGKSPWAPTTQCWTRGFSVAIAGGTLAGGRVFGVTSGEDAKPRASIKDFFATLYKACGLDAEKTYELEGRKFKYVAGGKPIDDLF
jgi:arylsulfatase A-like enzyme